MEKLNNQRAKGVNIGELFHEETKYAPNKVGGAALDWDHIPEPFKSHPSPVEVISLPELLEGEAPNVWEIFYHRRSIREYMPGPLLPLKLLTWLLWATQGFTAKKGGHFFRTVPSAGALHPIETYLVVRAVAGLDQGIYHFRPHMFDLELIKRGDFSWALTEDALGQDMIAHAQVTFIWTAVVARSKWKYHQRAYRYIYMDAGHIAQNLYLAGTASELGVCAIGAFFDDKVNSLIEVDGVEETTIYMARVGWPPDEVDEENELN